jgi:ATP-binding cassette subfamily B protein
VGAPLSAAARAKAARSGARSAWRRLARYVARHPVYYGVWVAVTLAYTAGFVAVGRLVGWAVEAVATELPHAEVGHRVAWLALVAVASASVRFYSRTLVFNAAREIEYELRNDLFAQLLRLPQSFYGRWRTGDIMSRCVNDTNAVRLLMGVAVLNVLQTPILYLAVVGSMLTLNPRLALFVLLPYPLFILFARAIGRRVHHWSLLTQEGLGEASNQLQEAISGIAVVKAYAMEGVTQRRFADVNQQLWQRQLALVRTNAAMPGVTSLLPALAMCLILFIGGSDIVAGRMEVADFFTFSIYVFQLTFPTFIMGWVVALVQRGGASMQRIDELLSIVPAVADPPAPAPLESLRGELEFRNLTFRHPGSEGREPALRDVSLRVPAGTTLGVVGTVGAGKTTLASLIPHLYEVGDGQVFVDGVDINRIALGSLRRHIAMVPQDSFLFSATLADNIAFGKPDATHAEIVRAAERAQLAKDVADLPHGYDTLVGERGVMLSGGQRQRTALARALLLEPAILVLDDTLSAVDAETEAAIQRELDIVFRGRTVVVVSSRVSAVRNADKVAVLDDGRVVEYGTHAELVRAGGLYARLAREQADREGASAELALAAGGGS